MKTKIITICILLAVLLSTLTSCGADNYASDNVKNAGNYGYSEEMSTDGDNGYMLKTESTSGSKSTVAENRKIIERINLTVETKTFDELMAKVENEITTVGGYVESSSVYGNGYYNYDGGRTANLTIRVPAESSGKFTAFISENSTVTEKTTNTDDVTLKYVDTESRLNALKAEKESLEELLKKAQTVDEIISVKQRLTDVIYEIESNASQLRTYDNLIDYTTVTLSVREVEKVTVVEEQTVWQKIGTNLKNNFESVWEGMKSLFVFAVSSLPYFLVLAVLAVIVIIIAKTASRKSKKRKSAKKEEKTENNG